MAISATKAVTVLPQTSDPRPKDVARSGHSEPLNHLGYLGYLAGRN